MVVLSVILTSVLSIKFCSKSKFITIYPPLHIHPTDMVYIIRKEGVNEKNGNYNIKTGYKPTENEVFKIEYDYQPTYEAYVNAMLNK